MDSGNCAGTMCMPSDNKYLRQRRGQWLVQVAVPKDLRDHFKRRYVERHLSTSSQAEAQRRKHAVVAEIFSKFDRIRETGIRTSL